jgi:hypothetical protein
MATRRPRHLAARPSRHLARRAAGGLAVAAVAGAAGVSGATYTDTTVGSAPVTAFTVPATQVLAQRVDTDGAGAYWPRLQLGCPEGTTAQYSYRDHLLGVGDPWHDWRPWALVDATR